MSLTSQLKQKNSPVRRFFEKFENNSGMMNCLSKDLQSKRSSLPLPYKPDLITSYSFGGTATDYLLRYTMQKQTLSFEDSFAYQSIKANRTILDWDSERVLKPAFFKALFDIGKYYLDGRYAANEHSVYSATALAVLEHLYRSGKLPKALTSPVSKEMLVWLNSLDGVSLDSKTAWYYFDAFYQSLGGNVYAEDIASLITLFSESWLDPSSELFQARIMNVSQSLFNSRLVDGADFDCIIECDDRTVLTDIKTLTRPLTIQNLRQLLGYALLIDPNVDGFDISDIGFYHARSASFRYVPIEKAISECLSGFDSVAQARVAFIFDINMQTLASSKDSPGIFKLPTPSKDRAEIKYVITCIYKTQELATLCYIEKKFARSYVNVLHPVGIDSKLASIISMHTSCPYYHKRTNKSLAKCSCVKHGAGEYIVQATISDFETIIATQYELTKQAEKETRSSQYREEKLINGGKIIIRSGRSI
jgi:hypothetical protein